MHIHVHNILFLMSAISQRMHTHNIEGKFGISTWFFYNQPQTEGDSGGIIPYTHIMTCTCSLNLPKFSKNTYTCLRKCFRLSNMNPSVFMELDKKYLDSSCL